MNSKKINKSNKTPKTQKRPKTNKKKRNNKGPSKNALVAKNLSNNVRKVKMNINKLPTPPAFSEYIRMTLFHDQPLTTWPLQSKKLFYKKIKYQDTLVVNASGNLFVGGSLHGIARFGSASIASPILYMNQTAYDPNISTHAALTGGWNTNIIGTTGTNVNPIEVEAQRLIAGHIKFSLTGVSNLNKQGQLHFFEDVSPVLRHGTATDASQQEALVNEYSLTDLPKCEHYKRLDIMNMDSQSTLEYNYIPLSLYSNSLIAVTPMTTSTSLYDDLNKNFGLIINSASANTTVRIEYELIFAQDIANDYINNYPPQYSQIYVDPNPTLQMLQQITDNIIKTEKHNNGVVKMMKEVNKHDHGGYSHIDGVELYVA